MLFNEFNFINSNVFEESRENDSEPQRSSFPLFNMNALRDSFADTNFFTEDRITQMVEEITAKKARKNDGTQQLIVKRRGRKAIDKNGKVWNDPSITMAEIIDNDLAGEPTVAEVEAKMERLRKMREAKALKRARKQQGFNAEEPENNNEGAEEVNIFHNNLSADELSLVPMITFKDGKIVVVDNTNQGVKKIQELTVVENKKPKKLNSMSFRTKNNANKWTEEETRKFYKAIEIFGADFSMIAKLFPTRNRDQVKNKFNKESKVNGKKVDEAFKRNSLLCKRSIMDRIKALSNNIEAVNNNSLELPLVALERGGSNASTDSMDLNVLQEIQDIFVKEIKAENVNKNRGLNFLNQEVVLYETEIESPVNELNVDNNGKEEKNEQGVVLNEQKNLLLRLFL